MAGLVVVPFVVRGVAVPRCAFVKEGAGDMGIVGLVVSRVMESLAVAETAPAPLRYCTNTVFDPSPEGRVNGEVAANGTQAPNVVPSVEKRMSETGSPAVGLVADRFSVTLVLLVKAFPELTEIVPEGAAVSR